MNAKKAISWLYRRVLFFLCYFWDLTRDIFVVSYFICESYCMCTRKFNSKSRAKCWRHKLAAYINILRCSPDQMRSRCYHRFNQRVMLFVHRLRLSFRLRFIECECMNNCTSTKNIGFRAIVLLNYRTSRIKKPWLPISYVDINLMAGAIVWFLE